MTQFFEISSLLSNPTAVFSASEHQKLLQEFERVKQSENGWRECVQYISSNQALNDETKFFCMQIIENFLKTRYKTSASEADHNIMKQFMSSWLQSQVERKANEKNYINRKAAQLFALVSLIDFPNRWPTFFNDLMGTSRWSIGNADFYLKVLMAIHLEIVDREIPRSPEEANLITFYKDSIRERCVNELVESWFLLLTENNVKNAEITCQTLEIVGAYISWIDINLIANQRFVEFFVYAFGKEELRESTCSCIQEVIDKKMEPKAKLKLIEYMWSDAIRNSALSLERHVNLLNDEADNADYLLKFGQMMNTIGENLYDAWQKTNKKEPELANELCKCMEEKIPYVLLIFSHSDDDISESVSEYCMNYISILKTVKLNKMEQRAMVENMFNTVINKMKYDVSYNFNSEGEDEAMFLEYRKNIKSVFDSIAQLDNDFVLGAVNKIVMSTAANWSTQTFADIENALHLLYLICEAMPSSQGNHFQPRSAKSDALCQMIQATITSELVQHPHRAVKSQYFENISRYYKFFQLYPNYISVVLEHFVGVHGLHNADAKLRSRVSYLFCRFTKDLKLLLNTYIEKILNSIQDLLIISSPLEQEGPLSSDDQLFLYETVSILIVYSNLEPKVKSQLMKNLLTPVVSSFSLLLNKYLEQSDEKIKLVYANSLNVAMQIASRASKGFSHQVKIKDCECVEIFLEILRIFMPSINVLTHKNLIHSGFRQYLHRMIVCLDNEVLEYLPMTIEHLLNVNNEPKDLYDLTPLLNQILNKYKFQIVRFMQTILMRFVNGVLNYVNSLSNEMVRNLYKSSPHLHQPNSPSHTSVSNGPTTNGISNGTVSQQLIDTQLIVDIQLLYKTYFQFLLNINNNELVEIVTGQAPSDIYKIFFSLIQGAQIGTHEMAKWCFQIIRKYITVFVDKQDSLPNFVQFIMENIVPCCIEMTLIKPNVDLNDAQQVFVFNEIGQCMVFLYSKFGEDFTKYLELNIFPTIRLNSEIAQALIVSIKNNNPKGLKSIRETINKMS